MIHQSKLFRTLWALMYGTLATGISMSYIYLTSHPKIAGSPIEVELIIVCLSSLAQSPILIEIF